MKKNELAEIKKMDTKAIKEKVLASEKEVAKLIMEKNMGKLSNVKTIKQKRRDIAQILTVLRQKELVKNLEERTSKKG